MFFILGGFVLFGFKFCSWEVSVSFSGGFVVFFGSPEGLGGSGVFSTCFSWREGRVRRFFQRVRFFVSPKAAGFSWMVLVFLPSNVLVSSSWRVSVFFLEDLSFFLQVCIKFSSWKILFFRRSPGASGGTVADDIVRRLVAG